LSFALALKFAKPPPQAPKANAFAIRFSVKIRKACGECAAFAKKVGPILVAAATAFNKYYKILAYSVGRESFASANTPHLPMHSLWR
jgi:hypothetical protein